MHITATKKNNDAPTLEPSDFSLIDPTGPPSGPFGTSSEVYRSTAGLTWPARYSVSIPTRSVLVFDVNPGLKGLALLIKSANVEVRLPDP